VTQYFFAALHRLLVTANIVPSLPILVTLMMEALRSSETSVLTRATRRNISLDGLHHETDPVSKTFCYYLNRKFWEQLISGFLSYQERGVQNDESSNLSIVLPNPCLAILGEAHIHRDELEGFMNHAVDVGSGTMI
jgi:hypothetical protein